MIEVNLIPDVKQELIRARKVRNLVVSGAIVVGIVSVGIVVLLAVYLFGVQSLRSVIADNTITERSDKLKEVPDLGNMLTIQSQLANIDQLHDEKNINSRVFDLLTSINPPKPNQVVFTMVRVDTEEKKIHLDGQASNGFVAADILKKTILATKLNYQSDDKTEAKAITDSIELSNLSYGEDSQGGRVLRFSMDFEYNEALFARDTEDVSITGPTRQNATDSFRYLPESLFGDRASDVGGDE